MHKDDDDNEFRKSDDGNGGESLLQRKKLSLKQIKARSKTMMGDRSAAEEVRKGELSNFGHHT